MSRRPPEALPRVAQPTPSLPHRSFLAFDFGTRRVGVATGNSLTRTRDAADAPSPPRARRASTRSRALIAEWQPDALVVGVPFHPDGARAREYRARAPLRAASCTARFGLPVHEVDERYTHDRGAAPTARATSTPRPRRSSSSSSCSESFDAEPAR